MTADPGTLYVVATPIGNLEDVTLRALGVLERVAAIAAEDTRVTSKLLRRHGIRTRLVSFREQNAKRAIPAIMALIEAGEDVALVSDAGTPSISDPGRQLVRAVSDAGAPVSPIPGPSALSAALSVAALDGDGVRFLGFLPRGGKRRRAKLASLASDPSCLVIYEAPSRVRRTLLDLAETCGRREAVVMREMTKVHEEIARGDLADLAERFSREPRGEVTIAVSGSGLSAEDPPPMEEIEQMMRRHLAAGQSARDAASDIARASGVSKKKIYDLAVSILAED